MPSFSQPSPKLHNIYMDKICPARYVEEYELVKMDPPNNCYSLRKTSTNEIELVTLIDLNTFYQIRVNYRGHF